MECLVAYLAKGVRAEIGDLGATIGYFESASDRFVQAVYGARAGNPADCTSTGVIRSLIPGLRHHWQGSVPPAQVKGSHIHPGSRSACRPRITHQAHKDELSVS